MVLEVVLEVVPVEQRILEESRMVVHWVAVEAEAVVEGLCDSCCLQESQSLLQLVKTDMLTRVFQNFWGNGNQSFLSTTFAPDCRETLRIAKNLRFLSWPGLQRWP